MINRGKKVGIIFLFIFVFIDIGSNIGQGMNNLKIVSESNANILGNTIGNIMNGGFVAEQAGWLYLTNFNFKTQHFGIYKMKEDGTRYTQISKDYGGDLNVIGDWIFYQNFNDCKLYKIQIDGKNRKKISNDPTLALYASKGWLYYINGDDRKIYKIKFDGNDKVQLSDDEAFTFNLDDEWLYYINLSDNEKLYKMRTDGSGRTKISDNKAVSLIKHLDWICFVKMAELYKMSVLDEVTVSLGVGNCDKINILDKNVIYSGAYSNKSGLYKIGIDGKENTKIITSLSNETNIREINIINDWIYFRKWVRKHENSKTVMPMLYRIKIDGTGFERIGL